MARRVLTHSDAILSEIADLLIEIRDRLPVAVEEPAQDIPEKGPVLVQEPAVAAQPMPERRKPGRPRKAS
jgi:hypothetical protein